MNLREINFSFGGLHCLRDFGLIYVEAGGHTITPPVVRNTYEIAGVSGNIIMPGVTHGLHHFSGNLFFINDPPDQATAQERLRKVGAWLLGERQRLIFDYEPQRFYLAEVNDATKWGFSSWIEGGLAVEFEAQPYAFNVRENSVSIDTAATSNTLTLPVDTSEDAPLKATIKNTGTAAITAATITANGKSVVLSGMGLAAGATLTIDMEPPIGAVFSTGASALPHAQAFGHITMRPGKNTVSVALTYGSGTKGAKITATARGRF